MAETDLAALIKSEVEDAVAPYLELLPPVAIDEMREFLEDMFATHPVASLLIARLATPPNVTSSGEVAKDGASSAEASEPAAAKRGKRR